METQRKKFKKLNPQKILLKILIFRESSDLGERYQVRGFKDKEPSWFMLQQLRESERRESRHVGLHVSVVHVFCSKHMCKQHTEGKNSEVSCCRNPPCYMNCNKTLAA